MVVCQSAVGARIGKMPRVGRQVVHMPERSVATAYAVSKWLPSQICCRLRSGDLRSRPVEESTVAEVVQRSAAMVARGSRRRSIIDNVSMTEPDNRTPISLYGKGTLRWAVLDHRNATRSRTWAAKCDTNTRNQDSVYVGTRDSMKDIKLSIHGDFWRLALTEQAAERLGGVERETALYPPTPEIARGWRRALAILTPSTAFRADFEESKTSDGRPIVRLESPRLPWHLRFDLLVADPGAQSDAPMTGTNQSAIGGVTFASGRRLWINAVPMQLDRDHLAQVAAERRIASSFLREPGGSSMVWGVFGGDGLPESPFLMDLACV